jgi:hypothetical protein
LAWLTGIVTDESDNWELRLCAGNNLLDYPRPEYRSILKDLADRQSGWGTHFTKDDVEESYSDTSIKPNRFENPWKFYDPEVITQSQIRWREEDVKENNSIWIKTRLF